MRLRHHSGRIVHLSSGIDVRPARDLPAVVDQLDTYAAAIRARLGVDTLGVSLWLPPTLAAALAVDGRSRTRLRAELDARGLEVVTLSGVPYAEGGGEDPRRPVRARLERPGPPASTPSTWPASWSTCCPTTPSAARSPPSAWAAGVGWDTGKEKSSARHPGPALRRARRGGLADRPRGPGRLPARARLRAGRHRSDRRRAAPGSTRTGSASASTWPASPAPGRSRPRPWTGSPRPASRSSGPRSPRPSRSPIRPPPPSCSAGTWPATSTRSPTRPARTSDDLSEALGATSRPARGGCAATCRCTPLRRRR